jgi:hypothetical protein
VLACMIETGELIRHRMALVEGLDRVMMGTYVRNGAREYQVKQLPPSYLTCTVVLYFSFLNPEIWPLPSIAYHTHATP